MKTNLLNLRRILFATIMLLGVGVTAWGADVTLFTTNFSTADGWATESIITSEKTTSTKTIKGVTISFKGYKNSDLTVAVGATESANGTLTFTGNNITASAGEASNANYYMAIPVTGVNGSLTVTTTGDATKWYYSYDDGSNGTIVARAQASANGGFTIEGLTNSAVTLYIGSSGKKMNSITLTTPEASGDPSCSATVPGDISKGANGNPLTLTAAGAPAANNTWYWQTAEDGEDQTHSGATFDVTAAGTYYVRSYCDQLGGCWSDAKSITVTDADLAPAVVGTIQTIDGEDITWDLTAITADMAAVGCENWTHESSKKYYGNTATDAITSADCFGGIEIGVSGTPGADKVRVYYQGSGVCFNGGAAYITIPVTEGYTLKVYSAQTILSDNVTFDYADGIYSAVVPTGKTEITIKRNSGATYVTKIELISPTSCRATSPGDISKGVKGNPLTLTAAGAPTANNTWYWQTTEDGEDQTHSGTSFEVTAAGTYYVRSYCDQLGGCWSDAKSVTVEDADLIPSSLGSIKTVDNEDITWDLTAITAEMAATLTDWTLDDKSKCYKNAATSILPCTAEWLGGLKVGMTGSAADDKVRIYYQGSGVCFNGNAGIITIPVTEGYTLKVYSAQTILSDDVTFDYADGIYSAVVPTGKTEITIKRSSGSTYVTKIELVSPTSCKATAPGNISKGVKGNPLTLTAEGEPAADNTWYWQTTEDGEDQTNSGATFDVTTAGTYYVRSYCDLNGGCWSDAKSITVDAADLIPDLVQVNVTGSTTWDWIYAGEDAEKKTVSEQLMANIDGINNDANFNSQALVVSGEYASRPSDKYFQGTRIAFNTTVPGVVTITYRSTGSTKTIDLQVNGTTVGENQNGWNMSVPVYVPAGEVVITMDGTDHKGRINKIVFDAEIENSTLRTLTNNQAGTICLTKNAVNLSGASFWRLIENNGSVITCEEVHALEAGKGYIFVPKAGTTEITGTLYGDAVAEPVLAVENNGLQGTFTEIAAAPDNVLVDNYLLYNNKIVKCGPNCSLAANRAYIVLECVPTEAPAKAPGVRRMSIPNANAPQTPTAIDNLTEDGVAARKVMVEGNLYIIREGKTYNANGQIVK